MQITVVLVKTGIRGNLGFTARVLANFGVTDLRLVSPRVDRLSHEARERAVKAVGVLEAALVVPSLEEAVTDCDLVVATTARTDQSLPLSALSGRLEGVARLALVFGPEEAGLSRCDLERAHLRVSIPTAASYPCMNLSHSVAVVLYEVCARHRSDEPSAGGRGGRRGPPSSKIADGSGGPDSTPQNTGWAPAGPDETVPR